MNCRPLFSFCLVLSAIIPCATGVVRRDDVSDSEYRKLGKRVAFASVGRVEIDYGRGFQSIGTATIYSADRLVSAAHVFDSKSLSSALAVRVNFGRGRIAYIDFKLPGVVNINPGYNPITLRNDVSVIFLPASFPIRSARIYGGRKVRKETSVTFVGYGDTGTGLTGSTQYSTAKRAGQNKLGTYYMGGRTFEIDFDRPKYPTYSSLGGKQPLRLEGLLGAGDSGGSIWIHRGGRWRLIGINSYGLDTYPRGNGNGVGDDYGDRSGFVYLPPYNAWITSLKNPVSS